MDAIYISTGAIGRSYWQDKRVRIGGLVLEKLSSTYCVNLPLTFDFPFSRSAASAFDTSINDLILIRSFRYMTNDTSV